MRFAVAVSVAVAVMRACARGRVCSMLVICGPRQQEVDATALQRECLSGLLRHYVV